MDDLDCNWHFIFILCLLGSWHLIKNVSGYILSYTKILTVNDGVMGFQNQFVHCFVF